MSELALMVYAPITIMLLLGLPHGALDAHILNSAARNNRQTLGLLIAYVLLTLATVLFWWAFPTVAVAIFLGLSAIHFGRSDLHNHRTDSLSAGAGAGAGAGANKYLKVFAHGGIWTVLLPSLQWDQVEPIFKVLDSQTQTLNYLLQGAALAWGLCLVVTMFAYIQTREIDQVFALFAGASLAVFAPPLWALCLYFCLWHARRHTSWVLSHFPPKSAALKFMFIFSAIPLAAMLYFALFIPHKLSFDAFVLQLFFIGIFALTVPHMLLIDYYLGSKPTVDR